MPYVDKTQKSDYDRQRYLRLRTDWLARTKERHGRKRCAVRAFIAEYKQSHPCVDCGESDPIVLDFDHIGGKSFNISHAGRLLKSIDALKREIEKCVVRCSNCHRRKTFHARSMRSTKAGKAPKPVGQRRVTL